MMERMQQSMLKNEYFGKKNSDLQDITADFYQNQIKEWKTQIQQKFQQYYDIEQITTNLKNEKDKMKKSMLWDQLNKEVIEFLFMVVCCEDLSIYQAYLGQIVFQKYQNELSNYFEQYQVEHIQKTIFHTVSSDLISLNLPHVQIFIEQIIDKFYAEQSNVKQKLNIEQLFDLISNFQSELLATEDSQKVNQGFNNKNKYYVKHCDKQMIEFFTQDPLELEQKLSQNLNSFLNKSSQFLINTIKKIQQSLTGPFIHTGETKFPFNPTNGYKLINLLFQSDNLDIVQIINTNLDNLQKPEQLIEQDQQQQQAQHILFDNQDIDLNERDNSQLVKKDYEKGKQFLKLIILEYLETLQQTNMHSLYYYSFHYSFMKFKNRFLLYSLKQEELEKQQPLGLYLKPIYKLCKEEFLSPDSEIERESVLYPARLKQSLQTVRKVVNAQKEEEEKNQNEQNQIENTEQQQQFIQDKQDNLILQNINCSQNELQVNLRICQEVELSRIYYDSQRQLAKRIFFEREKMDFDNLEGSSTQKPGGDNLDLQAFLQQTTDTMEGKQGQTSEGPGIFDMLQKMM